MKTKVQEEIMFKGLGSTVTYTNPSFPSPWGFDRAEGVIGAHISDFWVGEEMQKILKTLTRTEAGPNHPHHDLPHRQGTILVVDDEPQVREVISRLLARRGYTVITAKDGRDALLRFGDSSEINLVILDMVMPGMGGRECLARLRKANPAVPVVIVTGYSADGSPQELLGEGAMAIVEKPFDFAVFSRIVQKILET